MQAAPMTPQARIRPPMVERIAGWSARHRKTAAGGWFLLVAAVFVGGHMVAATNVPSYDAGQSGQAEQTLHRLNVTRALRPSAEISDRPPGPSGERMSAAERGSRRRAAATSPAACRSPGSVAKVRPGDRDWISTLSAGGKVTFSRCRACSACPDWPAS